MPKIEPHIKKYIDTTTISLENRLDKRLGKRFDNAITKARKELGEEIKVRMIKLTDDFKRHTSALVEDTNNRAKEIEIVAKKLPSEGRIRNIFREEMHPHAVEMNIYKEEVLVFRDQLKEHNEHMDKYNKESQDFRDEMRALRLNVNSHEKSIMGHEDRISSLELEAV